MNKGFRAVVNYVKNLFPETAPVAVSDNPQLDAQVVLCLSNNMFYTKASNGHNYWYCFVNKDKISVVKYILHSNGVNVSKHNSRFYSVREPVLRVRTSNLLQVPSGLAFVDSVMKIDPTKVSDTLVQTRVEQIRQRMK